MLPLVCPLCRIALSPLDDVCPRDGQQGHETAWLAVPRSVGQRFHVIAPHAHGATGSLYLVDEPATGRRGLLKLLHPVPSPQHADRQRLRRELVKQAMLARGNLLLPLASGEAEGVTWIFREWLDGVSLEVVLSRAGALHQTEAFAIATQVASALDELHRGGLLHRDVKPGHIFLQQTRHGIPRALLLDAGVAGLLTERASGALYGTAGYAAPEQQVGKLISFRSDLYSLGCVLYRMLTGRPAFLGESLDETLTAQRYGELPPMPSDLPHGIGALLRSILSKDPQERPFSAQKLRRLLDPFLPDGALMEKQPTTSFETLPAPRPSTAPEPTGTLRPPPPPSMRPSAPAPAGGTLRPNPSQPRPSQRPERKPKKGREEPTQQVELEQLEAIEELALEELQPAPPRRPTSIPPPVPTTAASSRPPARGPEIPSDKTQPIRLDQILSIAASRRGMSLPPPPASSPPPPPSREEQILRAEAEADATEQDASADSSPEAASMAPLTDASSAELDALLRPERERMEVVVVPADTSALDADQTLEFSELEHKATLMGLGDATVPTVAPSPRPASSERDLPTERVAQRPVAQARASERPRVQARAGARERDTDEARAGARQVQDAAGQREPRATSVSATGRAAALSAILLSDPRRLMMYASAALVGLGVLGVGASALFSGGPEPVAQKAVEQRPPAPPAVNVMPAPAEAEAEQAVALAEPPRPSVTPLATVSSAAATAAEVPTARTPEPQTPSAAELRAERAKEKESRLAARAAARATARASAEAEKEAAAQKRAEARAARKLAREGARREREAKRSEHERARSAKTEVADKASEKSAKTSDKSALFAEARDEARTHYAAKHYREAATAYERAARYDPTNAGIFAGLGAARLQLGENRAALQAYQHAVQLSPNSSGFQAALGRAYVAVGDKGKAAAAYKRALAIDSKNEAARSALKQLGG